MSAAVRTLASGTLFPSGRDSFRRSTGDPVNHCPRTMRSCTRLSFPTFVAGGNDAGLSHGYGGIHFQSGDYVGRGLGRQVAQFV